MTYSETLDYLFNRLPMFSRIGAAAYKKDLTNTIALCGAIGNPQNKFQSIHIAGTNGKGSTSHMLASVLQCAGYKVGLYTSPHLKDFRERIKINGEMCDKQFITHFVKNIESFINIVEPSFFELTVAMAFDYFAKEKVDIAVIETGLGGRLDSTNIIEPILSIITNIGYDHQNLLGNTLEEIAFEKAGIIKTQTPIVIGEYLPETKPVFENKAMEVNAPIFFAQENYIIESNRYQHLKQEIIIKRKNEPAADYTLDLTGIYQTKNLITVLESIHQLQQSGFNIEKKDIERGLSNVKEQTGLQGRWQCIQENPTIILDVAHNVDGIKQVVQQLEAINYTHLHIVMGMVKDKDINAVLQLLPKNASYYFSTAHIERAMQSTELQQLAGIYQLYGDCFNDVNTAIANAKDKAQPNDLILVCGSVFLVGEVEY